MSEETIVFDDLNVMRESAIKQAMATAFSTAGGAWKWAAVCRASMNPDMAALAPLYETIAETWALHAYRIMEMSPPIPKEPAHGMQGRE